MKSGIVGLLLLLVGAVGIAFLSAPVAAEAATVWSGPKVVFTKADGTDSNQAANQDRITSNVWLTRGGSQGLYNAAREASFTHSVSPVDTEWASGTTANYQSLTYTDWETWARSVGNPPATPGVNAVLHLKTDDIYLDIKFLSWSQRPANGGGFSYERSTAVISAPSSYLLTVNTVGSGTVTSNPAGIECGSTCSASFNSGSSVTLTATPASGSTFAGWSGDCTGTGACVLSLSAARSVVATFNLVVVLDTQPPSVPAPLTATTQGVSQINLAWGASSDDIGVTQYKLYRGGALLISLPATSLTYPDVGLAASTAYSYAIQACDAAGNCSVQSASVTATTLSPPDTTAPSVPSGLTAGVVSSSQIDLSWSAATDSVGVTAYKVYRGGVPIRTLGNVTSYSNTGLAAATAYSYTVIACDAAGNCSDPSEAASATTTPAAAGSTVFSAQILAKWNLLGNTGTLALDVATFFGTQDAPIAGVSQYVLSVWKWVVNPSTGAGKWAFFTPSLTKAESDAAALAQGYDALSTIQPGEGFWVNRTNPPGLTTPVSLSGPASEPFYYDSVNFGALKKNAWHLITTAAAVEPSVFNNAEVNPLPPSPEVVPTSNFQTLWAWSALAQKWYFYATSIEANGYTTAAGAVYPPGLDAVRQAAVDAGYFDFHTATPEPKTLGTGVGFWVRR